MADAEELSLEETNRLRIQAGLAPLGEETEEVIDEDQVAYDNYQQLKEDRQREKNAKEVMERIEKAKNRQKATEKLKGKGLGDASDDDESAMKFIKKSRKREKELAEKRARELLEMDKGFEGVQYDSADLSGMKVAHDMAEFEDGGEVILTLKDRGILDEEDEDGIELTNVNLEERERLRKNQENKKKKPGYNVYDDEEFTIGGGSKNLLSQYDEELEGPKRTSFVIGQEGRVGQETPAEQKASIAQKLKAQDLSYEKMQEVKDYYTHEEAALTFKKPKKKKKVRRRVAQDDEDSVEIGTPAANVQQDNSDMAVDEPAAAAPVKKSFDEENFVDDDDLQQALARTRRIANKKKQQIQRFTPEDIARNIAQQRDAEQLENAQNEDEADSGLVISDTSEFVNSLSMDPVIEREKRERERAEAEAEAAAIVTEMQLDSEEDVDMENAESAEAHENGENEEEASTVVDEPLVSRGMAATLALLNQKGFIAKPTEDQAQREKHAASRLKWVAEQKRKDAQRERERERDRLRDKERDKGREGRGRDYEREREHEREVEKERKERERMKEYEQRMKDYKPDVNIEYTDEFGKVMTPKEAYRVLSHKFHGKTSGKAKTEKRIRKMQEELALNSMGSSDTPHNLAAAMIDRQEKTGSAHFVLSVGNRGVLPGDENNAAKKRKTE
ncbi:SART-1 protein [Umbelopsis sp. AD052]|nr:SART-1 protein [Umbelopsis sp. AD052]